MRPHAQGILATLVMLDQIRFEGFMVSFEGLKTVLSPNSPGSTDAEDHLREARQLLAQYLVVLRDIERINLGMRLGGENHDQRGALVQIVQGRIDAANVALHPLYSVHRSDAAVHIEDPNPPKAPSCRTGTVYEDLWMLLHFEDVQAPLHRDEGYDRLRTHWAGYDEAQAGHWGGVPSRCSILPCSAPPLAQEPPPRMAA